MSIEGPPESERKELPPKLSLEEVRQRLEKAKEQAMSTLTPEERAALENVPKVEELTREGDDTWTHPDFGAPEYPAYKAAEEKYEAALKPLEAQIREEIGAHDRVLYDQYLEARREDKERSRRARIASKAAESGLSPEEYERRRREEGSARK